MAPFPASAGRQPRGLVKINGARVDGWIDFDVHTAGYRSADTFRVRFAAGALPASMNAAWFSQQRDMYVELFAGTPPDPVNFGPADLKSWIYAQVDNLEFDPVANVIHLEGRDLARLLIDNKTTQKWPNLTSSQIATLLAKKWGLTPSVTATTTPAGKFYELEHAYMAQEQSEWDILSHLADDEGFLLMVRGTTLYFNPKPAPGSLPPYRITWTPPAPGAGSPVANVQRIQMRREVAISRGVQVLIRSWNKAHGAGYVAKYPPDVRTITVGQSNVGATIQVYERTIPNLDADAALKKAQNWYQQIIAHEMKIDVEMPGDDTLDVTSTVSLAGTGTAWDQQYFPTFITRSMSTRTGYSMRFSAKNTSPDVPDFLR